MITKKIDRMDRFSIFEMFGFNGVAQFSESAFHPKMSATILTVSGGMGLFAVYFESFFGFQPMVGAVMLGLFLMELFTGVRASIKEGNKFKSSKFSRAWIKMFVYVAMIGFAHLLAVQMQPKPIFGVDINYYEWMHYTFLNYVLIQLFISNIENFSRLGWDEFIPIIGRLRKFLKLKKNNEDEEGEDSTS